MKKRQTRGCTEQEITEVLALHDAELVPPGYIEFLVERGHGPEVRICHGSRLAVGYPALLDLPRWLDKWCVAPGGFLPFALQSWDEGDPFYSSERFVLWGFMNGAPDLYRLTDAGELTLESCDLGLGFALLPRACGLRCRHR